MSCYLTIYGVPSRGDSTPLSMLMYSRNSEVYQTLQDTIHPSWYDSDEKYTKLTVDNLTCAISEIEGDIRKMKKRVHEYEKYAATNSEYIGEILDCKEYIEDKQRAIYDIEFIRDFVSDTELGYNDFKEVVCNVG